MFHIMWLSWHQRPCCLWTGLYFFPTSGKRMNAILCMMNSSSPSKLDWDGGLCKNLEVGNRFRGRGGENRRRGFDGLWIARWCVRECGHQSSANGSAPDTCLACYLLRGAVRMTKWDPLCKMLGKVLYFGCRETMSEPRAMVANFLQFPFSKPFLQWEF